MMISICRYSIALSVCSCVVGCSQGTLQPTTAANDPLYDISSWDFGDLDQETQIGNTSALHARDYPEVYAVAVATFTGPQHTASAQGVLVNLQMQYPNLASHLRLRERSRGSVLAFGTYKGFDDPQAKLDIETLRKITDPQGRSLFGQVLLTKFRTPLTKREVHPHDLWSVRKEFPTIVPIYTLEVAVWGDFDSGQLPRDKRHRAAESYTDELRQRGYEAFYYHNDDSELSSVTVGLFNYMAVDAETGFYSPEV